MTNRTKKPTEQPSRDQLVAQLAIAKADAFNNLSAALSSSFGQSSRLRNNYSRKTGSGDRVLELDREQVRDMARNLDLASDIASGFHDRIVDAVVGCGLRPIPVNEDAEHLVPRFMSWLGQADHRGVLKGGEIQRLVLRSGMVDGDVLTIKTNVRTLQIAESDQVMSFANDDNVSDGIHFDDKQRVKAYEVYPYNRWGVIPRGSEKTIVKAENALLFARRRRASMTRGLPILASALDRLADVDELSEAVLAAAKLAACLALVAESDSPGEFHNMMTDQAGSSGSSPTGNGSPLGLTNMEPGTLVSAPTGTKIKGFQGEQPTSQLEAFVQFMLRAAAAATGFPVEYLMRDLGKGSFSSGRLIRLAVEEAAAPIRESFIASWLFPVWEWWLWGEQEAGDLDVPIERAIPVEWSSPPMYMLDPQKEISAAIQAVNNNLMTKDEFLRRTGRSFESVLQGRKREVEAETDAGVVPPMPPGSPEASSVSRREPEDDD